jgi:hypothetical protein
MAVTARPPRAEVRWGTALASALAGAAWSASPTGVRALDAVWCGGFAGVLAAVGAFASPFVLLPAAAAAALLGGSGPSLGFAVAGVLAAVAATVRPRSSSPLPGVVSGLVALSLLSGNGPDSRPMAAITTTALAVALLAAGALGMGQDRRRRWVPWAIGGAGLVVACAVVGGVAAVLVRSDVQRGIDALRAVQVAGTAGDLHGAVADARIAEDAFRSAGGPLSGFGAVGRAVPILSQQLAATHVAVDTAGDAAAALRQAGESVNLDSIGYVNGKVDLAALAATEPALGRLAATTAASVQRLAAIDRSLLVSPVAHALDDALDEAQRAAGTADRLHRATQTIPALLGRDAPTRLLVLFTSPDEARNRFGFPGAYAVLRFDGGRLSFEGGGPISNLDYAGHTFDPAQLTVPFRAQSFGATREWRSVTIPPDGPTVADLALQLAAQSRLGPLDGVVLADPTALASVVGLLGQVPVPGLDVTLTRDTTVDFLVRRQYLEFPGLGQQADRKDLLSAVANEVGQQLASFSLPSIRTLADVFAPLVRQGHLVVSVPATTRPDAAQLFGDLGLDGAFPRPGDAGADLLFVGQRNFVGNKIDLFLQRQVGYRATIARNGAIDADLTLDVTNTAPGSGLPAYLIGAAAQPPPPMGTNLTTTLIYSRLRLTSLTVDGEPVTPPVLVDGGLLVYQVDLRLGPGEHRTIQAHLTGTAPPGPYALDTYPGGLVHPDAVQLDVRDARDGRHLAVGFTSGAPACHATDSKGCRGRS